MQSVLLEVKTHSQKGQELILLTDSINAKIRETNIKDGIGLIYTPHTTAAITINSYADINTSLDIVAEISRLVPTRVDFNHVMDTPTDAAGHIKSSLIGCSQSVIIENGQLQLGEFQSVFFWEFDGPRDRKVWVKILGID